MSDDRRDSADGKEGFGSRWAYWALPVLLALILGVVFALVSRREAPSLFYTLF